jgi:hypothetical protein
MIAGSAAGEGSAMTSTDQVRDAFVERLFASALGAMDVFTVYLGDRLGLYRVLAECGPLIPGELAERAGINARYAREWLEQQAATGILDVDDEAKPELERRFSLPAGHAEALIDPEDPQAMAALCWLAALGGALPKLVEAYRTGEGVAVEGADATEAQGDFNRPWLVGSLATEYLPLGSRRAREAHGRRARRGRRVRRGVGCRLHRARLPTAATIIKTSDSRIRSKPCPVDVRRCVTRRNSAAALMAKSQR